MDLHLKSFRKIDDRELLDLCDELRWLDEDGDQLNACEEELHNRFSDEELNNVGSSKADSD